MNGTHCIFFAREHRTLNISLYADMISKNVCDMGVCLCSLCSMFTWPYFPLLENFTNTHNTHNFLFHFLSLRFVFIFRISTISGTLVALFAIHQLQLLHFGGTITTPEKPYENWKLDMITLHLIRIENLKLKKENEIQLNSRLSCHIITSLVGFL